jgi:hypothetical protein
VLNPPAVPPPSFDENLLRAHERIDAAAAKVSTDNTPDGRFSRKFRAEEVAFIKAHIAKHGIDGAVGEDDTSYRDIEQIDNDDLASLFNACIDECDTPAAWKRTILTAILKKNKPAEDPTSYRTIALESCFLKVLSMLVHHRVWTWAEDNKLLPDSQNGFREGLNTNNNAFILKCATDRAKKEKRTLHVAYMDISNAFPSTNRAALWNKLRRIGMGGKLFDWIRMIYDSMSYSVRLNGELSDWFQSLIGVLIGDPMSSTLWDLYISDFRPHRHPDDFTLSTTVIANLEHADDSALVSYSRVGLQHYIILLARWCALNFCVINISKTFYMIFQYGPLPAISPPLALAEQQITIVDKHCYVGTWFTSAHRNVLHENSKQKAKSARNAAYAASGSRAIFGKLPPPQAKTIYTARIDPHLTGGAELSPNIDPKAFKYLYKVHVRFLRKTLALNDRSMVAPLLSELGLMQLDYRHLIFQLRFLRGLVFQPKSAFARAALEDSTDLWSSGSPGWVADLHKVLQKLLPPLSLPSPPILLGNNQAALNAVNLLIKDVTRASKLDLQTQIEGSDRLYLLHGRLEPLDDGEYKSIISCMRHYLRVSVRNHRESITQLLLGDHCLASEVLRRQKGRKEGRLEPVPRRLRLCRMCRKEIETPEHALLTCMGDVRIISARTAFLGDLARRRPHWTLTSAGDDPIDQLKSIIFHYDTIDCVAAYVHRILKIFKTVVLPDPRLTTRRRAIQPSRTP